jgi:alkylation response protein AidB-like acyl-CoA dehydrogenase
MRFDASDEQRQLGVTTRRFLESTVPVSGLRLLGEKNPAGFDRDWWRRAADLGWASLLVPETLGGSGAPGAGLASLADLAIVAEEYGRGVAPGPLLPASVAAWTLAQAEQSENVGAALDAIGAGEAVWAWVRGEGGDPWPQSPPSVRAVPAGNALSLTGTAGAVESGADADRLLVAVCLGDDVAHLAVPAELAGLERRRVSSLDLVRRHADLHFDGAVVPRTAVVIGVDRGRALLERQGHIANVVQCAEMVGAASRSFAMTLAYATERYSFGRPLASYQELKHRFADMKLWLEASEAAVEAAVSAVAADAPEAAARVSTAKLYVGRAAADVVQDCIQIHGGIGVTWEHDLHLYLRRVTTGRQLMGTPAEHTEHLASLLGL